MEIELVKRDYFNGVACDFYRKETDHGDMVLTRQQIGEALEYCDPTDAIAKIHRRNRDRLDQLSGVVKLSTPSGIQETTVYTARGVMEICRFSRQPKADAFMDWVWDVLEQLRAVKTEYNMAGFVAQVVKATVSECLLHMMPSANPMPADSSTDTNLITHWKKKAPSIIDKIDGGLKREVETMICSPQYTYRDVVDLLYAHGIIISTASVCRYAKRFMN